MVIGQSIENGLRAALIFILGLMTGLCGHTLLLVVGWAQFVGEQPQIISIMKGIGFVYFSFLGWKSIVDTIVIDSLSRKFFLLQKNTMFNVF